MTDWVDHINANDMGMNANLRQPLLLCCFLVFIFYVALSGACYANWSIAIVPHSLPLPSSPSLPSKVEGRRAAGGVGNRISCAEASRSSRLLLRPEEW